MRQLRHRCGAHLQRRRIYLPQHLPENVGQAAASASGATDLGLQLAQHIFQATALVGCIGRCGAMRDGRGAGLLALAENFAEQVTKTSTTQGSALRAASGRRLLLAEFAKNICEGAAAGLRHASLRLLSSAEGLAENIGETAAATAGLPGRCLLGLLRAVHKHLKQFLGVEQGEYSEGDVTCG